MNKSKPLVNVENILPHLNFIRYKKQEYLVCLSFDSTGKLIKRRTVTIGLVDMTIVHPREVFAGPLADRAVSIIVAHNHPSGIAQPSADDIKTTQQIVAAGLILGIKLRDHIIVTAEKHYSFRKHSMI